MFTWFCTVAVVAFCTGFDAGFCVGNDPGLPWALVAWRCMKTGVRIVAVWALFLTITLAIWEAP